MPRKKKRTTPSWKKILIAALAAAAIGGGAVASKNPSLFFGERVVEVVDGDTFIIENRQPIRLYGLNAPETAHCLGQEAKQALTSLVSGKRVFLKEPLSDGRGRIMALVYQNGVLVNEVIIKSGLAQYKRQGGSETGKLKLASDYARKNRIGIYSPLCYQTEPPDPACAIKGNYDEEQAKKWYFPPSCNYYSLVIVERHQGDDWYCTEREAQRAGFLKSPNCK